RVQPEDCRLLWQWANDAVVRATSFNPQPIPWDDHVGWFRCRLADPACALFVAQDADGTPVGQVRLESANGANDGRAVISIGIAREHRGKGYASAMIRQACRAALADVGAHAVVALIRCDNEPSRRAFRTAGFHDDGTEIVNGISAIRMVCRQ